MSRRRIPARPLAALTVALVALAATGCSKAPVVNVGSTSGDDGAMATGIVVSGRGTVSGTPDTVSISLGVSLKRPTAGAAIADAATAATRVLEALKASGVAEADLQTTNYSINQEFRYPNNGSPQPDGYRVSNTVNAEVRDVSKVGTVLDAATAAGGNDIAVQGLSFSLDDDTAAQADARERAFRDAEAKAKQYAELAGRPLGAVLSVSQTVSGTTPTTTPVFRSADAAASTPIQPGQVDTEVVVEVRFAFGD